MNEGNLIQDRIGKATDSKACAQRQSAHSVLQEHAERLRRNAGELHKEADRIEMLARMVNGIDGQAEEALWSLASAYIGRNDYRGGVLGGWAR